MRQRAEMLITTSIALPPELHQAVAAAADQAGTSFSAAIRAICRAWQLQRTNQPQEATHG